MSLPTSVPITITPAILDTLLGHLACHFLGSTEGDLPAARHAASRMLADYDAETEEELRLAAEIVSFGFHALEALSQAAAPDLSLNKILRRRGSAVSLSREAHKSQRKLDQLRRARVAGSAQPAAEAPSPELVSVSDAADAGRPLRLIGFASETRQSGNGQSNSGGQTRAMSRQPRRAARRFAENLKRGAAEHARHDVSGQVRPVGLSGESANQPGAL